MGSSNNSSISKEQHKDEEKYIASESVKCDGWLLPAATTVQTGPSTAILPAIAGSVLDNTPLNTILQSIFPANDLLPTQKHTHEDNILYERGPKECVALRSHRDGIDDGRIPYTSTHNLTPLTSAEPVVPTFVFPTKCTKIKFKSTHYMDVKHEYEWPIETDKVKFYIDREHLDKIRFKLCSHEGGLVKRYTEGQAVPTATVQPPPIFHAPGVVYASERERKFWCSNPEFPTPQNLILHPSSISIVTKFNKHGNFGIGKELNTPNSVSVQCVLDPVISFHKCDMSMLSNDDDDGCWKLDGMVSKRVNVRTTVTHTEAMAAGSRAEPVMVTENAIAPAMDVPFSNTHGHNINAIEDASVKVYKTHMPMKEMDQTSASTPVQTPAPVVKELFDNAPELSQRVHALSIVPVPVYVSDGVLNDDGYAPVSAPVTEYVIVPVPDYKAPGIEYDNTSMNKPVVASAPIAKVLFGNAPTHESIMFHSLVCALVLIVCALGPGNAPLKNHAPGYYWNLYAPGDGFVTEGQKAISSYVNKAEAKVFPKPQILNRFEALCTVISFGKIKKQK
ncbi:unnamed protein product [Meganyctiphanes norvegica]|uniref:Uncharacterized protein n=1 Tax=Meganyctiphanes norvegica TaxID=48144 RepID=A0AAV2SD39_MEGNR